MSAQDIITEHLDIWTTAQQPKKSGGRGRGRKANDQSLYGIKKLRELILDLAVRGKLVEQNPADEPASVLLEKIAAEKARLIKEKKIKKQKKLPEITEEEELFALPDGWEWVRLGKISEIERGGSPRPIKSFLTDDPDGLNWIKIGDTEIGGKYITSANEKIRQEGLSKTRMVYPGDFLLTNSMSFGRPYITKIEGCIHDGWLRISPPTKLDKDYLYLLLSSAYVIFCFKAVAAGAVVLNLNADKVRALVIPLPPLPEQHRIVAKVDELMALCDQLEQQQTTSNATHQTLLQTLLATLIKSADHETATTAWERIATHFDVLFTTEQSIDQLQQTILQLAVMGKLVPPACRQAGRTPTTLPVSQKGAWWVYVIECEDGSFHKGFTENLPRRWKQHIAGTAGAWTKKHPPKQVFYWEKWYSRQAALNREHYLKSGSGREWFQREVVENKEAWQPASLLLEKIAKEKARLIKEGKIKKQKKLPEITEEGKPFALPVGWEFSQFDSLMDITSGVTKGRKLQGRALVSVPYLRVANVQRAFLDLDNMKEIDIPEDELEKFTVKERDLLITEGGDWDKVGRTAIWGGELPLTVHQNHIFKARRILSVQNEIWVEKCLNSPLARDYFAKSSKQTTNLASINKTQLRGVIIPIPPLSEQNRIVAKVDELMTLCNQLKTHLHENQTTKLQLADTIVKQNGDHP